MCCISGHVNQWPLLLLLAVLISYQCSCLALQPCVAGRGPAQALQLQSADCSWDWASPQPNAVTILGALGQSASIPPAITAVKGTTGAPGPTRLDLANVVLDGFILPDPSSSPQALIPSGLLGKPAVGSRVSLSLQDMRILVDAVTLQQHAAFFSKFPDVTVYTDGESFLHVNYYATELATWKSVGLLMADSLEDARSTSAISRSASSKLSNQSQLGSSSSNRTGTGVRRGRRLSSAASTAAVPVGRTGLDSVPPKKQYNYVLAATQESLIAHMQQLGGLEGPTPCLIYICSNVTLSKPPVPASGIPVARPMFIVGLVRYNTSIDWYMQVNQIMLNYQWSNITFDSLAVENLAPGDAKSAELARPLSVSSANNFGSLYYNRTQDRLLLKNVTVVFGSQAELDYYMYWATVYHSKLPYFKAQAQFARDVIGIRVWKVSWLSDTALQVIKCYSGSCRVEDCTFRFQPVVAPRRPPPPPLGPDLKLKTAEKSPLVTAVGDAQAFTDQLRPLTGPEAGRAHVIFLRANITLQPLFTDSKKSSSSSNTWASASYVPAGLPPAGIPVMAPLSIVGDLSRDADDDFAAAMLDLGFARGLLTVSGQAGSKSQLQLQHLRLQGLSQGPDASRATSLQSPDVWTFLGWAFNRSAEGDVMLSGCVLELPPPEFDQLTRLAQEGGGQVVLKLSDDVRPTGDGLVVLNGVLTQKPDTASSNSNSSNSNRRLLGAIQPGEQVIWVESMSAQGMSGSKLMLVPSEAGTTMPGGYHWPGQGGSQPTKGLSGAPLAAAIAVPVAFVGAVGAAAAVVLAMRRRQRRRRQQMLPEVDKSRSVVLPCCSSCSSSYGAGNVSSSGGKGSQEPATGSTCCSIDEGRAGGEHGQQQHMSPPFASDAAVAVRSARPSLDVAAASFDETPGGHDQAPSSKGVAQQQARSKGSAVAGTAAGGAIRSFECDALSAKSLSGVDKGAAAATTAQRQGVEPTQQLSGSGDAVLPAGQPGLSHRLTSAISHLQHDITRRRISGAMGSGGQQPSGDKGSNSGPCSPQGPAQAPADASSSRSTDCQPASDTQPKNFSPSGAEQPGQPRQRGSLVAPRGLVAGRSAAGVADRESSAEPASELQILALIGRGSFASVFRAMWRGRCVALKVVQLPAGAAGDADSDLSTNLQARERMAVMEAVVSVTMSHPNIVQVYTFALQPLFPDGQQHSQEQDRVGACVQHQEGSVAGGWELQLIMEMCEEGSLRCALNQQRLVDPTSPLRLPAVHLVLALAHDVACAMLHLHSEQIVHSDLKASNVLLTKGNTMDLSADVSSLRRGSCAALLAAAQAAAGGRLVAKVADFGLSLALDPDSTHISHMHGGTLTHMSPELLLHGHASKASDVYAFGILLWELVTGLRAFQGMPVVLVGHNVTQLGLRPPWVPGVAPPLKELVEECWAQDPNDRPSFSNILQRLEQMLQQTPEELQVSPADELHSQQQQQRQGASTVGTGVPSPALLTTAGAPAQGATAAGAAAGNDAAMTGDWTM